MKTRLIILIGLAVAAGLCTDVHGQGTAFTYQGRLNSSGNPASGSYDFRFKLFVDSFGNTQAGSTVLTNGVPVTNGLFTVAIDFGAGMFTGTSYWLEVGVRTNGTSSYTSLAPLQPLTPSPYAIFANGASSAATATTAVSAATATTAATASAVGANGVNNVAIQNNAVTTAKIAGGQVVKSLNGLQDAVTLSGGDNVTIMPSGQTLTIAASAAGWSLTGNAGTTPGANFLGTTDNEPLELLVNSSRALRLEPNANGPNVIGGFSGNNVGAGAYGVTIAGGGVAGSVNQVSANVSTIGGGFLNNIQASEATIAGGYNNTIQGTGSGSCISGGEANIIQSIYGTIPGGYGNTVTGPYSYAAGRNETASGFGSFVWSDGNAATASTGDHQFIVRCTGGASFYTANGTSTGVQLAGGGGSWSNLSDRDAKENFAPVDARGVLEKVAEMPITTWNYKAQAGGTRHIGPMAQDFYTAFGVGEDERHITTVDEEGVALAAIKGLNGKLQEKDAEIQALKRRLDKLERALSSSVGNH
jgi:hypothetical protein